jgi:hypothetical protein
MRDRKFKFRFKGGPITVWAFNEEDARILARAEAIKKGWDSTLIPRPKLDKLDMVINWKQLSEDEQCQLHDLLCKVKYNGQMEDE